MERQQIPRRSDTTASTVERVIAALIEERQQLRREGADAAMVEALGLAIAYWQDELASARVREQRPA